LKKITTSALAIMLAISACQKDFQQPAHSVNVSNTVTQDTTYVYSSFVGPQTGVRKQWGYFGGVDIWLPENDYHGYRITRTVWSLHKLSGLIKWRSIRMSVDLNHNNTPKIKDISTTQAIDLKVVIEKGFDLIPQDTLCRSCFWELHGVGLDYFVNRASSGATMTVNLYSIYISKNGVPVPVHLDQGGYPIIQF